MKRVVFLLVLFNVFFTAFAVPGKPAEAAKKGYDFTQPQKIVVLYKYLVPENAEHPDYQLEADKIFPMKQ